MHYIKRWVMFLLIFAKSTLLSAQSNAETEKVTIKVFAGFTEEDFNWSIAGNIQGQNPNIYSELIWKGLKGPSTQLDIKWNIWSRILLEGQVGKTFIISGSASDTDYGKNNRQDTVFHAIVKSDKGSTSFIVAGAGYKIVSNKKYQVVSTVGYGLYNQALVLLDNNNDSEYGKLHSSYKAQWQGPFVRLMPELFVTESVKLRAWLSYQQLSYKSTADWNLIDNFKHPVSFRHTANGYGTEIGSELSFNINSFLVVNFSGSFLDSITGYGVDELYLKDGAILKTRFNQARRKFKKLGISITMSL